MSAPPVALLERVHNQRVELRLKDGRRLAGRLLGYDDHMNLVLDGAEETAADVARHLGRVVVRGSNVVYLNIPTGAAGAA